MWTNISLLRLSAGVNVLVQRCQPNLEMSGLWFSRHRVLFSCPQPSCAPRMVRFGRDRAVGADLPMQRSVLSVPLQRMGSLLVVTIQVNGTRPAKMILDTGASPIPFSRMPSPGISVSGRGTSHLGLVGVQPAESTPLSPSAPIPPQPQPVIPSTPDMSPPPTPPLSALLQGYHHAHTLFCRYQSPESAQRSTLFND